MNAKFKENDRVVIVSESSMSKNKHGRVVNVQEFKYYDTLYSVIIDNGFVLRFYELDLAIEE